MVTKFEDIAKGPSDLLSDDYTTKTSLKCKKGAGPLAVTIETERSSSGSLSSKVGSKFKYAGLSFDKIQVKADGSTVLETSLKPCPGCSMTFKGSKSADLGIDYTTGKLRATGSLDVKDLSKLSTSVCLGLAPGVDVGADAAYSRSSSSLSSYGVGASYTSGSLFASVTTASKFSQVNIGLLYTVNKELSLATTSSHSKAKPMESITFGGKYNTSFADVKAKLGSDGSVSACVIKEVFPKVTVTASGSTSTKDISNIKYGFGIVI